MQEKKANSRIMWPLFFAFALAIVFMRFFDGTIAPALNAALNASAPFVFGFVAAYLLIRPVKLLEKFLIWISKKRASRWQRVMATTLIFLLFTGICWAIIAMLLPKVVSETIVLIKQLPDYIPKAKTLLTEFLNNLSGVIGQGLQIAINDSFTKFANNFLGSSTSYLVVAKDLAFGTIKLIFNIVIGTIAAFYIVLDFDRLKNLMKRLLRSFLRVDVTYNDYIRFFRETDRVISKFIIGRIITSAVVGMVCFIGFSLIGVKSNFLVCTIIAVTNLIPYVGPFIGAVPPLLITVIDDPAKALWVALYILVVQQLEGNIIGPKIVGDMLKVSPFWILVGVILGGAMFGLAGALLGAPCVALIAGVLREFMELRSAQRTERKNRESDM